MRCKVNCNLHYEADGVASGPAAGAETASPANEQAAGQQTLNFNDGINTILAALENNKNTAAGLANAGGLQQSDSNKSLGDIIAERDAADTIIKESAASRKELAVMIPVLDRVINKIGNDPASQVLMDKAIELGLSDTDQIKFFKSNIIAHGQLVAKKIASADYDNAVKEIMSKSADAVQILYEGAIEARQKTGANPMGGKSTPISVSSDYDTLNEFYSRYAKEVTNKINHIMSDN